MVNYAITSFKQGFLLKYQGPRVNRQPQNLKSAFQFKDKLWDSLMKEVHLGRMIGPFSSQPIEPLICSSVGMVKKKNSLEIRRVMHLSYPKGSFINTFIDPADAETHYQTFEAAVNLVAKAGQGAFIVKEDFKSAFCSVPMAFSELNLLGIKVEGKYFIDCALPFGASISCKVFEDIGSLIHWIAEKRAGHKFVHYLGNFFTVHRLNLVCSNIMAVFKLVCAQIGMLISPDKSERPTQIIEFLGLTIDMIQMVIRIPKDKMQDITLILITVIHERKATAAELESLMGKLNFVTKAVPAGRSFTKSVYQSFQGVPKHRHINLTTGSRRPSAVEAFPHSLQRMEAHHSPFSTEKPNCRAVHRCIRKHQLRMGAWLSHTGAWMHGQWEAEFFNQFYPSIDFL